MRKIALLFILLTNYAFSQSVNDYQYVMVPSKFSIFKEENKFNSSMLIKFMLKKYGFEAVLPTDQVSDEVANYNCRKLFADLAKDNGILNVKVKIQLKDCKGNVVYETAYGKSKEKDLNIAYNAALREAGQSFEQLDYKYNGKSGMMPELIPVHSQEQVTQETAPNPNSHVAENTGAFYFAQPTANGFQIVDNEPKIIMKLYNTSQKNVFMAVKGDVNGTVISKNGQWVFEYYKDGNLVSEPMNLKF